MHSAVRASSWSSQAIGSMLGMRQLRVSWVVPLVSRCRRRGEGSSSAPAWAWRKRRGRGHRAQAEIRGGRSAGSRCRQPDPSRLTCWLRWFRSRVGVGSGACGGWAGVWVGGLGPVSVSVSVSGVVDAVGGWSCVVVALGWSGPDVAVGAGPGDGAVRVAGPGPAGVGLEAVVAPAEQAAVVGVGAAALVVGHASGRRRSTRPGRGSRGTGSRGPGRRGGGGSARWGCRCRRRPRRPARSGRR